MGRGDVKKKKEKRKLVVVAQCFIGPEKS